MRFSERNASWEEIPPWVDFSLRLGYEWAETTATGRRICLISMPCDSAGAGLIALGAMRKRLELRDANDLGLHFHRIQRLSDPRLSPALLRHKFQHGRFEFDQIDRGIVWLKQIAAPMRMAVFPHNAEDWRFEGEAPVRLFAGARVPHGVIYAHLIPGQVGVLDKNLAVSDSGVCVAGRVSGASSSEAMFSGIRFQGNGEVANLDKLLTVQNWSPGTTSRISFFNTRTEELDRDTGRPELVVADGTASFLKVADRVEFAQSDIIAVMHRTADRDVLDEISVKIADLRQWYATDPDPVSAVGRKPPGIEMLTLKRG